MKFYEELQERENKTLTNKEYDLLKDEVKDAVPISLIIENRLGENKHLNPFRDDKNGGSWTYSDSKQIFYDFASGDRGNLYTFIRRYDGVNFKEAILRAAYEGAVISRETYLKNSKDPDTKHAPVHSDFVSRPRIKLLPKRADEIVDEIYTILKDYCGLSSKHRSDLMVKRFISPEDIVRAGYFTLKDVDVAGFIAELGKHGYNSIDLLGIPGFYLDNKEVKMAKIEGLAIPLYTPEGKICAIQVRRDNVGKDGSRYVFLSSSRFNMGCLVGTPTSTVRPKVRKRDDVFITEGQFKAIKLAEKFKAIAMTIQGVNSTKGLDVDLPKVISDLDHPRVLIALDADIYENPAVKNALLKLYSQVSTLVDCEIKFVVWDYQYGKGIDDMINNGHLMDLKLMDKDEFYKRLGVKIS